MFLVNFCHLDGMINFQNASSQISGRFNHHDQYLITTSHTPNNFHKLIRYTANSIWDITSPNHKINALMPNISIQEAYTNAACDFHKNFFEIHVHTSYVNR